MPFDPFLAELRFGYGLSPALPPPASAQAMLDGLRTPDTLAKRFPIEPFDTFRTRLRDKQALDRDLRRLRGTAGADAVKAEIRAMNRGARDAALGWLGQAILRRVQTPTAFRERLEAFWADHFTAAGKAGLWRRAGAPYVASAIRPHLAGRFEVLLIAAVTHPLMLHYLDQDRSVGPNSLRAQAGRGPQGLNENLAREVLELHTLGAGGPYAQDDVRELAELLTGLTQDAARGRVFRADRAEPGSVTVLGRRYGGDRARFADIEAVLTDLARHPATAAHLARKLARHFTGDSPDAGLVAAVTAALRDSGCDLGAGYAALLDHPAAWAPRPGPVRPPFGFVASACRALAVPPAAFAVPPGAMVARVLEPMRRMGQAWEQPDGPDGLPQGDAAWITPQGLAARLQWAVSVPRLLLPELPDPRDFASSALGPRAQGAVLRAAAAAETRADGVGLVLAAPAFQRM